MNILSGSSQIFISQAIAIVLEAAPFLLLGSFVSALAGETSLGRLLARATPRSWGGGILVGLLAGLALPTCECGVVPVARRLLRQGLPSHTVMTYMLAAPVVNPVVLLSTWVAFQGDWASLAARVGVVTAAASAMGWSVTGALPSALLRGGSAAPAGLPRMDEVRDRDHGPDCGCGHDHGADGRSLPLRLARGTALEFLDMAKFLILGALAAAAVKTFMPSSLLMPLQSSLALSVAAMMGLAVLLSVCSEADAFVAASFTGFPWASHMAFVTLGPMVDLKLLAMFYGVFHRRLATALAVVPALLVFVLCMALGLLLAGGAR